MLLNVVDPLDVRVPSPFNNGALMKKFAIVPPRPGRTTVSLVAHQYNADTKRTKTAYAGSFPLGLDPAQLVGAPLLLPGQTWNGLRLSKNSPISLNPSDITTIRQWLETHGSVAGLTRVREDMAARSASERAALRAELTAEVEAEMLAGIRVREVVTFRLKGLANKLRKFWNGVLTLWLRR